MVFPVAMLGAASIIGGHAARIGITSASLRGFSGQFVQSLPFGAGYSLGTYLGFPKNYQQKGSNSKVSHVYLNRMPYGYYPRRRSYRRYGRRYYSRRPRYYRRYRRF